MYISGKDTWKALQRTLLHKSVPILARLHARLTVAAYLWTHIELTALSEIL